MTHRHARSVTVEADALGDQFVRPERVLVVADDALDHHLVDADAVGEGRNRSRYVSKARVANPGRMNAAKQ